jgi:NTP pyrophosphatase (non-canonical NTP hydrolase)
MPPITIKAYQEMVDQWVTAHGVRYFSEMTNLAILMEEVGEVARVMARNYGEQSYRPDAPPQNLSDELADVMFVLTCLANQTGVDLTRALQRNLDKKTQRDSTRHWNNPKLTR